MKMIHCERVPRKYHLLWDQKQKVVRMQIHKDCIKSTKPVPPNSPIVQLLSKEHEADGLFDSFSGDLSADFFGFNRIILKTGESGDYVDFVVPIPEIKKTLNMICEECSGLGKRIDYGDDDCLHCDGSGKKHINDWQVGYLTTASLGLLFEYVLNHADDTHALEYQHMTLSISSEHCQHGGSLHGFFGVDFSEYIHSGPPELEDIILKNTVEAMRTAYRQMLTMSRYNEYGFKADVREDGYLFLNCPGTACGVHHTGHGYSLGRGQKFTCHNVDSPAQSLTLFAGLASLVGQVDFYLSAKKGSSATV